MIATATATQFAQAAGKNGHTKTTGEGYFLTLQEEPYIFLSVHEAVSISERALVVSVSGQALNVWANQLRTGLFYLNCTQAAAQNWPKSYPRANLYEAFLQEANEAKPKRIEWASAALDKADLFQRTWAGLNALLARNGFPRLSPTPGEPFSCVAAARLIKEQKLVLKPVFRFYS